MFIFLSFHRKQIGKYQENHFRIRLKDIIIDPTYLRNAYNDIIS